MTNPNTGSPIEMTMPEVLDGVGTLGIELDGFEERLSADEPDELARLTVRTAEQLDRCAEYGQRMWHHLEAVATYLRDGVARSQPLDDAAAREWATLYSATLQLLAGPRGDNGFGDEQARHELQDMASRGSLDQRSPAGS